MKTYLLLLLALTTELESSSSTILGEGLRLSPLAETAAAAAAIAVEVGVKALLPPASCAPDPGCEKNDEGDETAVAAAEAEADPGGNRVGNTDLKWCNGNAAADE